MENHDTILQAVAEEGTWEGTLDFAAFSNDSLIRSLSGNPTRVPGVLLAAQAAPGELGDKGFASAGEANPLGTEVRAPITTGVVFFF